MEQNTTTCQLARGFRDALEHRLKLINLDQQLRDVGKRLATMIVPDQQPPWVRRALRKQKEAGMTWVCRAGGGLPAPDSGNPQGVGRGQG